MRFEGKSRGIPPKKSFLDKIKAIRSEKNAEKKNTRERVIDVAFSADGSSKLTDKGAGKEGVLNTKPSERVTPVAKPSEQNADFLVTGDGTAFRPDQSPKEEPTANTKASERVIPDVKPPTQEEIEIHNIDIEAIMEPEGSSSHEGPNHKENSRQERSRDGDKSKEKEPHFYADATVERPQKKQREKKEKKTESKPQEGRAEFVHRSRDASSKPKDQHSEANEKPWLKEIDPHEKHGLVQRTMGEIFSNENDQLYFGKLLKKYAPDEADQIMARYKETGKINDEEAKLLDFCRWKHAELIKECDSARPGIDVKFVERVMNREGDFGLLGREHGKEKIVTLLKEKLPLLAIDEPEAFKKFTHALHVLEKAQNSDYFKRHEKRIHDLSDAVGINDMDFDKIFDFKDIASREKTRNTLLNHDRAHMSKVQRIIDKVANGVIIPNPLYAMHLSGQREYQFGSMGRASRRMEEARRIQSKTHASMFRPSTWAIRDVDESLKLVVPFLNTTVINNEEIRSSLRRAEFTKEKVVLNDESGPHTLDGMNQAKTKFAEHQVSEASISKLWERDIKKAKNDVGKGWNDFTQEERTDFRNRWTPSEEEAQLKNQKGLGVFASILRVILAAMFKSTKQKMSTDDLK